MNLNIKVMKITAAIVPFSFLSVSGKSDSVAAIHETGLKVVQAEKITGTVTDELNMPIPGGVS